MITREGRLRVRRSSQASRWNTGTATDLVFAALHLRHVQLCALRPADSRRFEPSFAAERASTWPASLLQKLMSATLNGRVLVPLAHAPRRWWRRQRSWPVRCCLHCPHSSSPSRRHSRTNLGLRAMQQPRPIRTMFLHALVSFPLFTVRRCWLLSCSRNT